MRLWELLFTLAMILYQTVLFSNRRRRVYPFNFSIYLVGALGGLSLVFEGWRWVSLPLFGLWFLQAGYLLLTMGSLREGFLMPPGVRQFLGAGLRVLGVMVGFLLCCGVLILEFLFPLPIVTPSGPWEVSSLTVSARDGGWGLRVWFPSEGGQGPELRSARSAQVRMAEEGAYGIPHWLFQYLDRAASGRRVGGHLATGRGAWPVVYFFPGGRQIPDEWGFALNELASRGYVVVSPDLLPAVWVHGQAPLDPAGPFWTVLALPEAYRTQPAAPYPLEAALARSQALLRSLATQETWKGRLNLQSSGLIAAGTAVSSLAGISPRTGVVCAIRWGAPALRSAPGLPTLEVPAQTPAETRDLTAPKDLVSLLIPGIRPADLDDSAFLRPYLFPLGSRNTWDGRAAYLAVRTTALFLDWKLQKGDGSLFTYGRPDLPGGYLRR